MALRRDAADDWFSKVVRLKADWTCECCGRQYGGPSTGLHCAHIYGRANKRVRWSLDNAVSLCFGCHQTFTANPLDFHSWLQGYLGEGHMEMLNEKRHQMFKTTKIIRKEISDHYREEFRTLMDNSGYTPISYN